MNCGVIREAVVDSFANATKVTSFSDDLCAIKFPIQTVDGRYVAVFVKQNSEDFFLVHDGGKTVTELFSHGLPITAARRKYLTELAEVHGVALTDEDVFQVGCRKQNLETSVLSIIQCISSGMVEILNHKPRFEEESVVQAVGMSLRTWKPSYIREIKGGVRVEGQRSKHVFDFVSFPENANVRTVGVKILSPTYGALVAAQRFGFFSYDIKSSYAGSWPKLAVLAHGEKWKKRSINLVNELCDEMLILPEKDHFLLKSMLPGQMEVLHRPVHQ